MSLYLKGMDMPRDCPACPMAHYNKLDEFTGCAVVARKRHAMTTEAGYADTACRPAWCPLAEVPPHGRLIDADALRFARVRFAHSDPAAPGGIRAGGWNAVLTSASIEDAPTVIEADRTEAAP